MERNGTADDDDPSEDPEPVRTRPRKNCYCFQYFTLKFLHKPHNNGIAVVVVGPVLGKIH